MNLLRAHGTNNRYQHGCTCALCRAAHAAAAARYRAASPEQYAEHARRYNAAHPGRSRAFYAAHAEQCRDDARRYYAAHPEQYAEWQRRRNARLTPQQRGWQGWRRQAGRIKRTQGLTGNVTCLFTLAEYVAHVEPLFRPGMSWENYGQRGWHNDHVTPIASWTFVTVGDLQWDACWSLDNLRPEWGGANSAKSDRIMFHDGSRAARCHVIDLPAGVTYEAAAAAVAALGPQGTLL